MWCWSLTCSLSCSSVSSSFTRTVSWAFLCFSWLASLHWASSSAIYAQNEKRFFLKMKNVFMVKSGQPDNMFLEHIYSSFCLSIIHLLICTCVILDIQYIISGVMLSLRLTLAIKKNLQLQNEEHHCNTSPAAVTAHTDYETKMILFILDLETRVWCREHRS